MGLGPGADGAHGHVFFFQFALFHQPTANRAVRVAVLVAVTHTQLTPAGQLNTPRALDLQELQVHRVGQPGDRLGGGALAVESAGVVIRLEHTAFQAPAQALALELRVDAVEVDDNQVVRHAVYRHVGGGGLGQAAGVDRLVITRDQAVWRVVGRTQAEDIQVFLEKATNRYGIARYAGRCRAGWAPDRVGLEALAGAAPGFKPGEQVAVGNARQGFPRCAHIGGNGVRFGWLLGNFFIGVFTGIAAGQ